MGLEAVEGRGDGVSDGADDADVELAHELLELGEDELDGVEVRRVGWEIIDLRTPLGNGFLDSLDLVRAEVVHDDDVTGPEGRREHLLDVGLEGIAIYGAVDEPWSGEAVDPEPATKVVVFQ